MEIVSSTYGLKELMIIEAARHIADGNVVIVGTGLPMVATTFAFKTHAPNLVVIVESGPIDPVIMKTPISVSDPRAMHQAARLGSLREVLGCVLQRGLVDVGFIGGAQIDQYGNINSTVNCKKTGCSAIFHQRLWSMGPKMSYQILNENRSRTECCSSNLIF